MIAGEAFEPSYEAFMLFETLLNAIVSLLPTPVIAVIAAIAMSAAIKPYSIAVAPFESRSILTRWCMSLLHGCEI